MNLERQIFEFLNDTSHHVKVTGENRHIWLLSDEYRNKPWTLLTPRGLFESDRLYDRWIVPVRNEPDEYGRYGARRPDDVFHLSKIIWHSDEDGWVAQYVEREP